MVFISVNNAAASFGSQREGAPAGSAPMSAVGFGGRLTPKRGQRTLARCITSLAPDAGGRLKATEIKIGNTAVTAAIFPQGLVT
jgi:hypothetical protein